jgi:uncharacterized protein
MKQIILDTNSLMAIDEFKLDIFSEIEKSCNFQYKLCTLSAVIEELEKIMVEQRGKYKLAAKLALKLLKSKNVFVIKTEGYADDLLAEYSKKGYLVLTQDVGLKKRLTKPYLTIRQKKKVVLIN